jgi:hypothetical protein
MKHQTLRLHRTILKILLIFLSLMPLVGFAAATSTILDYSTIVSKRDAVYDPFIFGKSDTDERKSVGIYKAWQTETLTIPWTSLMLEMVVKHKIAPTRTARGSALLHVAMFDSWQLATDDVVKKIAVSTAAVQVLAYWFPAEEHGFDRILAGVLQQLRSNNQYTAEQLSRGLEIGRQVGTAVVARGESDGAARGWNGVRLQWYGEGRYYGLGSWEPTAPYFYYPPDEPFAPTWKTWVLDSASQFRPTPPAFGSKKFIDDLQEVIELQKNLTPEQLQISKFWVDGSGSVTPPGHWNQIGLDLSKKNKLSEEQAVKLFAILNIALADTFIAVWDVKYHYWTARPITVAKSVLGIDFKPAILTPPFPSYVSGHAAFSGAAARVLGVFFPYEANTLDAMAEQAAHSRLLGGIHYRHDNEDGLLLGRNISDVVVRKLN